MIQTAEAIIDASAHVRLLGEVRVDAPRRALVMVLDELAAGPGEAALLAEPALASDWSRPEEDAAWSYLQPAESSSSLSDTFSPCGEWVGPGKEINHGYPVHACDLAPRR